MFDTPDVNDNNHDRFLAIHIVFDGGIGVEKRGKKTVRYFPLNKMMIRGVYFLFLDSFPRPPNVPDDSRPGGGGGVEKQFNPKQ